LYFEQHLELPERETWVRRRRRKRGDGGTQGGGLAGRV